MMQMMRMRVLNQPKGMKARTMTMKKIRRTKRKMASRAMRTNSSRTLSRTYTYRTLHGCLSSPLLHDHNTYLQQQNSDI